ncbi:MAG: hypothetical protein JXR85_03175 [Deltaproteobacteria bacterium]|nr:hypothetical protein [Deltaproteobacteria bacterium]
MKAVKHFSPAEIACVNSTFVHAEELLRKHYGVSGGDWKSHRYDVKTLAQLKEHEVNERAFAHLCKYCFVEEQDESQADEFCFYRVCLQDNRILNAVERAHSFIKLHPLMLYIATHELVHIVRFNRGEGQFNAPLEEKMQEEETVHTITRSILQPVAHQGLNLVLDCFSDQYHIGDIFN